ncbi:MAG: protein kinase [Planctomycetota bacterium]
MKNSLRHPAASVFRRFLEETLNEAEEQGLEAHLEQCAECRAQLEREAGTPDFWERARDHLVESGAAVALPDVEQQRAELRALLDPSDDPSKLGRIGAYEIQGLLGRGTHGLVFKAFEPRLNRFVAIKLLSPDYRDQGPAVRRFEREARAIAAVAHQHVVPIYAVDEHHGLPYIVMQYVAGSSLQQRIDAKGPLDTTEVTRIGLQVARGLAAAHAQGVVHRDVKPANVILEDGVERVMVSDFGLASVGDEAGVTHAGTISGTPHYMSPEQARGEGVDARSDLFSLGSLMYTAATGRPPFRAESVFGVLHRVNASEPRRLREIRPELEPWLEALIARLMAKDPKERFQSAREVADALASELAWLQDPGGRTQPARAWLPEVLPTAARPRLWRRVLTATAAACLIGGFAWWAWDRGGAAHEPGRLRAGFLPEWSRSAQRSLAVSTAATDPGRMDPAQASRQATRDSRSTVTQDPTGSEFEVRQERPLPAEGVRMLRVHLPAGQLAIVGDGQDAAWMTCQATFRAADSTQAQDVAALALLASDGNGEGLLQVGLQERPSLADLENLSAVLHVPENWSVQVRADDGDVEVSRMAGSVEVTALGAVRLLDLTGPVAASSHGELQAMGLEGAAVLRSSDGSISILEQGGELDVMAVRGDVYLDSCSAKARLRTSTGNIYVRANPGDVYAQTSGGDIVIAGVGGPIAGHAALGSVYLELPSAPAADCAFSSAGGNVHVLIGEDVPATVMCRGERVSDWPFTTEQADPERPPYGQSLHAGGGAEVQLGVTYGQVILRNAPAGEWGPAEAAGAREAGGSSGSASEGRSGAREGEPSSGGLSGGNSGASAGGASGARRPDGGSSRDRSGAGGESRTLDPDHSLIWLEPAGPKPETEPRVSRFVNVSLDMPEGNMDGYSVYLPPGYSTEGPAWPVIVYLQGAYGVGGPVDDHIHHWGLPRILRDENEPESERAQLMRRFIVLCPHIVEGGYDQHPERLKALVERILENHNGDPDRVYLTGVSRGGHGTWGLAHALPGTFAAIAPVGGLPGDWRNYSTFEELPIWIAHNQGDSRVEFAGSERAMATIESMTGQRFAEVDPTREWPEGPMPRHVHSGVLSGGHDAWSDLYGNPAFYRWLLSWSRRGAESMRGR